MNYFRRAIPTVAVAAGALFALLLPTTNAAHAAAATTTTDLPSSTIESLATRNVVAAPACAQVIRYPGYAADPNSGGLPQALLSIMEHVQHTEVWCWAAVSAAVTEYFRGHPTQDCEMLSMWWQANGQPVNCCAAPYLCERPASTAEIQTMLLAVSGVRTEWVHQPLSECALRQELANGRPVIAALNTGSSGHVVLITGYDATGFTVEDPYFGPFPHVAYEQILSNATLGVWIDTLFLMDAPRQSVSQPPPVTSTPPPQPPVYVPSYGGCSSAPPSMLGIMLATLLMMRFRRRR